MKEHYTITSSWNDVELVCCNRHEHPIQMVIQQGPSSPFYACPKYHEDAREEGERACNNRLSLQDYSKMLSHLHDLIGAAEMNDERVNLTNYTWKDRKGTEFKVLEHNGDYLVVRVYNKRAINS